MPTSILVWNVQSFTLKKIHAMNRPREVQIFGKRKYTFQMSQRRLRYITENIKLKKPDIFVLIEVISGQGKTGSLINSYGALGAQYLLRKFRDIDPNWCLVPPLRMINKIQVEERDGLQQLIKEKQYTESVGIFYRKDKLKFTGPYVWPKTEDPDDQSPLVVAIPNDGKPTGPYPPEWQTCLPTVTDVNACQVEFFNADKTPALFPSTESRNPYLAQFQELTGKGRTLKVVAVHLPPAEANARTAFSRVTSYFTDLPLLNNEMMLMVGDFNLPANAWYYKGLKIAGNKAEDAFTPVFTGTTVPPSTMFKQSGRATPSQYLKNGKILDNILYRYGKNAKDGNVTGQIIDRVANNSLMLNDLTQIQGLSTAIRQKEVFRRFLNFGQLGPAPGTSDHLAVFATL